MAGEDLGLIPIPVPRGWIRTTISGAMLYGTHAARPGAGTVNDGAIYAETDTNNLFQAQTAAWVQLVPSTGAASSGATLPVAPVTGQLFLHTPTGRSALVQWDGAVWQVVQLFGNTTLYVSTTGTDDMNHGTGTGANAFLTINYTLQFAKALRTGSFNVYIGAGTFTETLNFSGITPAKNNNTATYWGTMTQTASLTATGGTNGSALGHTQVTGAFVANQYNSKMIHFTSGLNNGSYRIIGLTTVTTLWLEGDALPAAPANGDTYEVLDWGTIINGQTAMGANAAIVLVDLALTASTSYAALAIWGWAYAYINRCKLSTTGASYACQLGQGFADFLHSLISIEAASTIGLEINQGSTAGLNGVKVIATTNVGTKGLNAYENGVIIVNNGCEVSGCAYGFYNTMLSLLNFATTVPHYIHGNGTEGLTVAQQSGAYFAGATYITFGKKLDATADANTSDKNLVFNTLSADGSYIGS